MASQKGHYVLPQRDAQESNVLLSQPIVVELLSMRCFKSNALYSKATRCFGEIGVFINSTLGIAPITSLLASLVQNRCFKSQENNVTNMYSLPKNKNKNKIYKNTS